MSQCEEYQELISRLVDGDLTVRERAALEEHVHSCPDCAALYSAFSAISQEIAEDMEEVPPDLRANVMAEIRREEIRKKNRMSASLRGVLAAAACLAIIVGVSLGVLPQLRGHVSAAAFPEMEDKAAENSNEAASSEHLPEPEPTTDPGQFPPMEEATEFEDPEATEEDHPQGPKFEFPFDDPSQNEEMDTPVEENIGSVTILDWSSRYDFHQLRELLGGEQTKLTEEELEEDLAWIVKVKGELGVTPVSVYVREGQLYYWDPVEHTMLQAQLSLEEFESLR